MPQPNVLLIHCHDIGRHLNCYGAQTVTSPNLDGLATDGVLAEQMFATAPQCSPSRASLFTGRWPHSNGVLGLAHESFAWDMHPDERHLARHLKNGGFNTELVGVMHETRKMSDEGAAERHGFDRVRSGGLVDEVAERTTDAIRRLAAADEPFYLQVGFFEPHRMPGSRDADGVMGFIGDAIESDTDRGVDIPPYLQDSPTAREEIAELQGAIKAMDAGVGEVLRALDGAGIADNTITIFTTDHGLALPRAKCSLFDPGLEIAFIVRWPDGGWSGGRRLDESMVNIDIVPTLLDALQLGAGDGPELQGRSFRPLLNNQTGYEPREITFGEMTYHDYYDPRRCARTERYKVIVNFSNAPVFMDPSQSWARRCAPAQARNGNSGSHPTVEMYDLQADPVEFHDIGSAPAHAEVRDEMLAAMWEWMESTGDPLLDGAVTSPKHRDAVAAIKR